MIFNQEPLLTHRLPTLQDVNFKREIEYSPFY